MSTLTFSQYSAPYIDLARDALSQHELFIVESNGLTDVGMHHDNLLTVIGMIHSGEYYTVTMPQVKQLIMERSKILANIAREGNDYLRMRYEMELRQHDPQGSSSSRPQNNRPELTSRNSSWYHWDNDPWYAKIKSRLPSESKVTDVSARRPPTPPKSESPITFTSKQALSDHYYRIGYNILLPNELHTIDNRLSGSAAKDVIAGIGYMKQFYPEEDAKKSVMEVIRG